MTASHIKKFLLVLFMLATSKVMESGRKLICLMVIMLIAFSNITNAQNPAKNDIPLHVELGMNLSTPHKGIMPAGAEIDLNYSIKRFSIHAIANSDFLIPKEGETENFNKVVNLGGGLGFELFPAKVASNNVFEVRANVTSSVGSKNFKNISSKIGLYWYPQTAGRRIVPLVGVGYSLKDFSNINLHSYHGGYVAFGLRF